MGFISKEGDTIYSVSTSTVSDGGGKSTSAPLATVKTSKSNTFRMKQEANSKGESKIVMLGETDADTVYSLISSSTGGPSGGPLFGVINTSKSNSFRQLKVDSGCVEEVMTDAAGDTIVQIKTGEGGAVLLRGTAILGIKTAIPQSLLHIGGDNTDVGAFPNYIAPTSNNGVTPLADPQRQGLLFDAYTRNADGFRRYADIVSLGYANGSSGGGVIRFLTNNELTTGPGGVLGAAFERMRIERNGNVGIGTTSPSHPLHMGSGAHVTSGGTWTNASDANLKENFLPVDGEVLLEKLANLPIQQWNYRNEDPSASHIGPTAQDFQATFGVGSDGKSISTIDPSGIALAAIQALNEKLNEQKAENEALKAQIEELREMIRAQATQPK